MKKSVIYSLLFFVSIYIIQSCRHLPPEFIPTPNVIINPPKDTSHPCNADTVYYAKDIQPLFNAYCVGSGCHNPPSPQEGLNLTTYSTAVGSGKIIPYNSSGSKVYRALTGSGGDLMPPSGKLSADKIALIKKWIDQGAKNLFCDDMVGPCDTSNVTYSTTITGILTNNCIGCHGSGASGGVILTNYTGVKTVIADGRLWNAVNHLSGVTKAMPNSSTKLNACNLRQIKIWINAGAPQN